MSTFVDGTLLRFAQDTFVTALLRDGIGLGALFNAIFDSVDVEPQSIALGPVSQRSYKVPVFETVRSSGTDERVTPDVQRVRKERVLPRHGRLDWVDVAFDATLDAQVKTLTGPLQGVTAESLEEKLGNVRSVAALRAALLALYPPSIVDEIFRRLRISTFDDYERQKHLFIELVGAPPPDFQPNDPANFRSYPLRVRIKIADSFDVANALQAAKLCRNILEFESVSLDPEGVEQKTSHAFVTLFNDASVTDTSLPHLTGAQAKAAVQDLFAAERMFAQFIT